MSLPVSHPVEYGCRNLVDEDDADSTGEIEDLQQWEHDDHGDAYHYVEKPGANDDADVGALSWAGNVTTKMDPTSVLHSGHDPNHTRGGPILGHIPESGCLAATNEPMERQPVCCTQLWPTVVVGAATGNDKWCT